MGERLPDSAISAARRRLLAMPGSIAAIYLGSKIAGLDPVSAMPWTQVLLPPAANLAADLTRLSGYALRDAVGPLNDAQYKEYQKLKASAVSRAIPWGHMGRDYRFQMMDELEALGPAGEALRTEFLRKERDRGVLGSQLHYMGKGFMERVYDPSRLLWPRSRAGSIAQAEEEEMQRELDQALGKR